MTDSERMLQQAQRGYVYHILSQRRIALLLLLLALAAGGFLSRKLSVGLYPKVERAKVSVSMPSSDLAPIDFFEDYGQNLEESFETLEGLSDVDGSYNSGWVTYLLTFDWGISSADAKRRVEQLFSSQANSLPKESKDDYRIYSYTSDRGGSIYLTFYSATLPPESIYQLAKQELLPRLRSIKGITYAEIPRLERLISNVILDRKKMLQYGITPLQVASGISGKSKSDSISSIRIANKNTNLRLKEAELSLYNLENLVVTERGGLPIYLRDIADIEILYEASKDSARVDGQAALLAYIGTEYGSDLRLISQSIDKINAELRQNNKLLQQIETTRVLDPADYINLAIRNVLYSGIIGAILAILIVIIFLGQWRNIVMIAFSIPLTIVISLIMLYYRGISINMISLGGMTIATGMVVDASIVVTENIHRIRMEQPQLRAWQAISCATQQVWLPVLASTVTSVVVFLPLSFTAPLANAILSDLAQTIVFALLASLAIALFVVPLLAFYMLRGTDAQSLPLRGTALGSPAVSNLGRLEQMSNRFSSFIVANYRRILERFLSRPRAQWVFIAVSLLLFVASLKILGPRIQQSIIGTPSSNRVILSANIQPGYEEQEDFILFVDDLTKEVQQLFGPKVKNIFMQSSGTRAATFFLTLSSSHYGEQVQKTLKQYLDKRVRDFTNSVEQQEDNQEDEQGNRQEDHQEDPQEAQAVCVGDKEPESQEEVSTNTLGTRATFDPAQKYYFYSFPWDPASLPLPEENDLSLEFRGSDTDYTLESLQAVMTLFYNDRREREEAAQKAFEDFQASQPEAEAASSDASQDTGDCQPASADDSSSTADGSSKEMSADDFYQGYRYFTENKPDSLVPQPILNLIPRQILLQQFPGLNIKNELNYSLSSTVSELEIKDKGETRTVRIRNPRPENRSFQDLYDYPIQVIVDKKIQYIPLHHFVTFERDEQESSIFSRNGKRQFSIIFNLQTEAPPTPSQIAEAKVEIEALLQANLDTLSSGVSYSWVNTKKEVQDSIRSLTLALAIALLLVFLVITAQFGSYRYPLIILVTVPLGITGSIFFLWLTRSSISLNSLLGMILLGGVAVNNAIIMIDFFLITLKERLSSHASGEPEELAMIKRGAIVHACSLRLIPILITMFTTLLGILPIALALGDGMNVLQPLGIAVAGGLAISTMFTLFMIPSLLNIIPSKRERHLISGAKGHVAGAEKGEGRG